jgi:predicted metal-dependent phosphoesterase TrpH
MSTVVRLDLHSHTLHSGDCFVPLEEAVDTAVKRGLTHLAITDHDSCECARRQTARHWPIQLIFGEEVTLANGTHVIALGVTEEIKSKTLREALREIRAAGGFIVVPHPFKKGSGIMARPDEESTTAKALLREFADAIEVCNSKLADAENEQAFALARELGKPMTAGSDAHFGFDVADAVLEIEVVDGTNDWRELIRSGRKARVLMNRFVRQKGFDEHLTDTRVNNLLPSLRRWVPKPMRTLVKRTLHRALYQPRVQRRDFALEELRF